VAQNGGEIVKGRAHSRGAATTTPSGGRGFRALTDCPASALRRLSFVLTDIDGTLTTNGRLTAAVYEALEHLTDAGIRVVPITGRPAGWCDLIARQWPVDSVVGENGAFWFRYEPDAKRLAKHFIGGEQARVRQRAQLSRIGARILKQVPGSALASDQSYRDADLAIDYAEDVHALPRRDVDRIVSLMERSGLHAKVSSIHVNGWFGRYDKLTTTRELLRRVHGLSAADIRTRCAFAGDSPNDAPMFGFFPLSVGVANVREFADRMDHAPAFVTRGREGAGFVEFARRILRARRQ
jgi:HAD superfamily hydrolase (TIGR01484 family)